MDHFPTPLKWPPRPYKGLGFYEPEDRPIFAGREQDLDQCATLLGQVSTRLLLLHGPTGCGKSSFLRAGLIPYLEETVGGFRFLKESPASRRALLVTATADPLPQLGRRLYEFAGRSPILRTPKGEKTLDLSAARLGITDSDAYALKVTAEPNQALESLQRLARTLPGTLVLIIDQAEEVFTLQPGPEGQAARQRFFDFLHFLNETPIDLKLLLVLRTEYHGRLVNEIHRRVWNAIPIREYLLSDLNERELEQAIKQPTAGEALAHYRFSYEPDLAARIARELKELAPDGGVLPVMQIVCSRLYDRTRGKGKDGGSWAITAKDYDALGGIQNQIGEYLREVLRDWCQQDATLRDRVDEEVQRWQGVLHTLVHSQPDGTVTTNLFAEEDLLKTAQEAGCRRPAETLAHLAQPERCVLRRRFVYHREKRTNVRCYSLGHDMIGLALATWKLTQARTESGSPVEPAEAAADEVQLDPGIALCLSGGDHGAILFHLGALWRLNEAGLLPQLTRITSVESASILAAFLALRWNQLGFGPDGVADNLVPVVVQPLRQLAWRKSLDPFWIGIGDTFTRRYRFNRLVRILQNYLFQNATLQDLPNRPRVVFSATNVQTGARWHFSKQSMGDSYVGYVESPDMLLADAVAACGTPAWTPFASLALDSVTFRGPQNRHLANPEQFTRRVMLLSGHMSDPLGLEHAWPEHRQILVSDATWRLRPEPNPSNGLVGRIGRSWDLAVSAFRNLRRRQVVEALQQGLRMGAFWSIGSNIANYGLDDALPCLYERTFELATQIGPFGPLSGTLSDDQQERLINWGYAISDAALRRFFPQLRKTTSQFPFPNRGV